MSLCQAELDLGAVPVVAAPVPCPGQPPAPAGTARGARGCLLPAGSSFISSLPWDLYGSWAAGSEALSSCFGRGRGLWLQMDGAQSCMEQRRAVAHMAVTPAGLLWAPPQHKYTRTRGTFPLSVFPWSQRLFAMAFLKPWAFRALIFFFFFFEARSVLSVLFCTVVQVGFCECRSG